VVIGPGTGLGCSILINEQAGSVRQSRVLGSEYAHVNPSAMNALDLEIIAFAKHEYQQEIVL
jgi:glucokinase